jgi:hypothetical protein
MHNQISLGFELAFFGFIGAWLTHLIIWRIRRPEAYPLWLLMIFYGAFAVTSTGLSWFFGYQLLGDDFLGLFSGMLAYTLLTVNYISCYAGIIEYSPSAEILFEVAKHMPAGVVMDSLNITSLSDEILTVKRIDHLLRAGMIREEAGLLALTPWGRHVVQITIFYRRLLFQPPFGEG